VGYLRRAGVGKRVRIEGPSTHVLKTGTHTMGGLLFTFNVLALTLVLTLTLYRDTGRSILLPTGVMLAAAVVGAYDDKLSLVGSVGVGLSGRFKFGLLGVIALAAALLLWHPCRARNGSPFRPRRAVPNPDRVAHGAAGLFRDHGHSARREPD